MLWKAAAGLPLQDCDYVPLALPTTDLRPLDVLTGAGRVLRRYSRLDRVLAVDPATPEVEIAADQTVVASSGADDRTARLGIGLGVVSSILEALGGEAGLTVDADRATQVRYAYSSVTSDRVDLVSLDEWLTHADFRPGLRNVADLLTAERLYVVVGILKVGGLEVEFLGEHSAGVDVDVPAIQGVIGGNVTVSTGRTRSSRLVFTGAQPLTIAAKAARLRIDDHGIWVNERLAGHDEIRGFGDGRAFLDDDVLRLG
jgi:hypothetical protein